MNKPTTTPRPAPASEPPAYRIEEARQLLRVSRATIYRMEKRGQIRIVRIGGCAFVPAAELRALFEVTI